MLWWFTHYFADKEEEKKNGEGGHPFNPNLKDGKTNPFTNLKPMISGQQNMTRFD